MRSSARRRRRRPGSDQGDSLIELLCAVVILGIAGVAIMAGFSFLVKSSDIGRKQANSDGYVRSLAEAIQRSVAADGMKACGSSYLTADVLAQADLHSYTPTQGAIQSWTGSAWGPCTANGSQRIELTVTSAGTGVHKATEKLTLVLRKPCNGTVSNPC